MKIAYAALILIALPLASQADPLDIKTGAWELTEITAINGVTIPKETLDKLPPTQRDEMEVKMRASANNGDPVKSRRCVTQEDLAGNNLLGKEQANCTRKVKYQTKRFLELEENCAAPDASKTIVRFEAASKETYSGNIDRTQGEGAVHIEIVGRWIGPTCEKGLDD